MSVNKFLDKVDELLDALKDKEDFADADLLYKLERQASGLREQYDEIMTVDRDLKLGIVGRVKAGKSSFLNSLLFEGQDCLPKAATPMTAALTRINYAPTPEEQKAEIHFYSAGDWNLIEAQAAKLDMKLQEMIQRAIDEKKHNPRFQRTLRNPQALDQWREAFKRTILAEPASDIESLKICRELVDMAGKHGIKYTNLPHTPGLENIYRVPLNNDWQKDFSRNLDEFVGGDGKYTPFVKYLELYLYDERLNGIEVVDTPGLNDPVSSRVDVTNGFLRNCDAVLLLSGVSHFLDANDADLVGRQIREASIDRVYIIGTMLDIGLMECPTRNVGLQEAYDIGRSSYYRQAKQFLAGLGKNGIRIPKGMDNEDGPQLVSAVLYSISRKMRAGVDFSIEENHVLGRLTKLFPDFRDSLKTAQDFEDLSGFEDVKENIYKPVRADKELILRQRVADFQAQQIALLCKSLEDIAISSDRRRVLLENNDMAGLKEKQAALEKNLQNSRIEVRNIFDELKFNFKSAVADLKINMREAMGANRKINVETRIETSIHESGVFWKDYSYTNHTIYHASTSEATNNIENYALELMRLIDTAMKDIFNREDLERKLRNAIFDTFQAANADSSKADIIGPVQALLQEISIPEIDYSAADEARKAIFKKYTSEVRDSEVEELKKDQAEKLAFIYNEYVAKVDKAFSTVSNAIDRSGATFVDKVCEKVNTAYETLQKQLRNKDTHIQFYKEFRERIKNLKNDFLALE